MKYWEIIADRLSKAQDLVTSAGRSLQEFKQRDPLVNQLVPLRRIINLSTGHRNIYAPAMSKLIAVITAGVFAAGTMFAADPNQCVGIIAECKVSLAKLDVPQAKKNTLNQHLDHLGNNGCPPDRPPVVWLRSGLKHLAEAYFNPEQYATFKAECKLMPTPRPR